ncbi:MAG: YbaN family protein [Planctomycetes bacterium]|nr:YbaN family protein [Planctomycetota bacterium]MCB9902844.1 YbaN family protein [Planctomycetota bacterium]
MLGVGSLSTGLALFGAFLPILPTTPFLLLAMACFVRSSPELNRRLLANRAFGPYLAQWQHDHTVPRSAKRKAYGLVVVSLGLSIWFVDVGWVRLTLGFVGLGLLVFLSRLRTTFHQVG